MTRLPRFILTAAALALSWVAVTGALAQPADSLFDHYKVYNVEPKYTLGHPVILRDQFSTVTCNVLFLDRYSNPVDKNGEGIRDPALHYSWWRIDVPEPPRSVLITNQFGPDQHFITYNAEFLLNPSLKFPQAGQLLPDANHYKCYRAVAPPVNRDVSLVDQWGARTAFVDYPELLCNPVEKTILGAQPEPIVDPDLHLACYRIQPPIFYALPAPILDEFGLWDIRFVDDCLLCVPSLKDHIVPTVPHTWGRVKDLYR